MASRGLPCCSMRIVASVFLLTGVPTVTTAQETETAKRVLALAERATFAAKSTAPSSVDDALDYFPVTKPQPALTEDGSPSVLSKVVFKTQVRVRETGAPLNPGVYFHWIGRVEGMWRVGFAKADGSSSASVETHFALAETEPHPHFRVLVHSLDDLWALGLGPAPGVRAAGMTLAAKEKASPTPKPTPDPTPKPTPTPRPPRCMVTWLKMPTPRGPWICAPGVWVTIP